jgi:hypothetical protein
MGERVVKKFGEMTMGRYVIVLGLVLGIVGGLVLLLSGCDKEVGTKELGEKVEVRFSLNSGVFENEARSGGTDREIEKAFIPAGDGMYFEASLRETSGGGLRALVAPEDGQLFYFGAFKENGEEVAAPEQYVYRVAGDVFEPVDANASVKVPFGGTYVFVAYSYAIGDTYVEDEPEEPEEEEPDAAPTFRAWQYTSFPDKDHIDFSRDLVYGKSVPTEIDEQDKDVSIDVYHKAPRVKVQVSVSNLAAEIVDMEGLVIRGNKKAELDVWEGELTLGADADINVGDDAFEGVGVWWETMDYHVIYPTVTSVFVGQLDILLPGSTPHSFSNLEAKFHKTLDPGYSYLLLVELKETRWAGSNIYWDPYNERLRFEEAGDRSSEDYQGVFFKFGSLVGIAPDNVFSTTGTIIYVPPIGSSEWDETKAYSKGYDDWDAIPYLDAATYTYTSSSRSDKYVTDVTASLSSGYRGDICQYIGSIYSSLDGYRLPTSAEFGGVTELWDSTNSLTNPVAGGWVRWIRSFKPHPGPFNPIGNTPMGDYGGAINTVYNGFFPASGRYDTDGNLLYAGRDGWYWSSSATSTSSTGKRLYYDDGKVNPNDGVNRGYALSVRCIKKLPSEP